MTKHLTDGQLWASVDGGLDPAALAHLEACGTCRERQRDGEAGLLLAGDGGTVPEPSPLYWEAFRRQVERRIAEEPAPSIGKPWRRFLGLGTLVPLGVAAALIFGLGLALRQGSVPGEATPALPAWEALPSSGDDDGLDVLRGLALSGTDLEAASGCRDVADCLTALSDDESRALADAMRERMPGGRS